MDVENYKIERGNNSTEYFLNIADFIIKIFFENKNISNIDLLPSLDIYSELTIIKIAICYLICLL